jgi:ABC-2 type transport system permease protein
VIPQTKAELLKIRSTRTTLGLVLGMVALVVLFGLLTGLLTKTGHLATKNDQRALLDIGSLAAVFSALAGILLVTSEYRYGTIRPTFLFSPRRSRVVAAKLAAGLLSGLALGIAAQALGAAITYICLSSRGISFVLSGGDVALLVLGTIAAVALWGALGVGIGFAVRNQVGSIIGLLAWGFIVDSLLFAFVPSVGRFTPTRAQDALAGLTTKDLLAPAAGGAILIAWAAALALTGLALTARRDVA